MFFNEFFVTFGYKLDTLVSLSLEAAETAAKAAVVAAAGVRKLVRFEDSERAVVKVGRLPVEGDAAEEATVSAAGVKGDASRTAAEKAADSAAEMKGDVTKITAEKAAEKAAERESAWTTAEEKAWQAQILWRERQKLAAPGSNSE